jgi:hypothetical protein
MPYSNSSFKDKIWMGIKRHNKKLWVNLEAQQEECPAGTGGTNNNKGQTKLKTYATLGTIAMIKGMMDSNIN